MLRLRRGSGGTTGPPDLPQVCKLLDQLDLRYFVDSAGRAILLSFHGDKADYDVYIIVDHERAIVYIGLAGYLTVPRDHPSAPAIMSRLMELNWELSLAKFEWHASGEGEVRISFTFTTENGIGAQALGAAIASLLDVADRYYIELHAMLEA
jgi:hypothetical protein